MISARKFDNRDSTRIYLAHGCPRILSCRVAAVRQRRFVCRLIPGDAYPLRFEACRRMSPICILGSSVTPEALPQRFAVELHVSSVVLLTQRHRITHRCQRIASARPHAQRFICGGEDGPSIIGRALPFHFRSDSRRHTLINVREVCSVMTRRSCFFISGTLLRMLLSLCRRLRIH